MTELEKKYSEGTHLTEEQLCQLISKLREERDCWVSNSKGLQKQVTALEATLRESSKLKEFYEGLHTHI